MSRTKATALLVVFLTISTLTIGSIVHAQSVLQELQARIDTYFAYYDSTVWHATSGYIYGEQATPGHGLMTRAYQDSAGNILILAACQNSWYGRRTYTVCTSAPNACGATGTGFVDELTNFDMAGNIMSDTINPCSAQTPPASVCPARCTPQTLCRADGNLYDSCTNALVQSCAAGCAGSQCNRTSVAACTPSNICAADGNVRNSCTGALVQECAYGCAKGACLAQEQTTVGQCSPQAVCYADGNVHNSCTGALTARCEWGCANGICNGPPRGTITSFSAMPSLVSSGATSVVSWQVKNVTECDVVGSNQDRWSSSGDGSFNDTSSAIIGQTHYTLTCTGLDGNPVTSSVTVNILPRFREQ